MWECGGLRFANPPYALSKKRVPRRTLTYVNALALPDNLKSPGRRNLYMQLRNSPQCYGAIPQAMHWLTVALVILAWLLGQFDDISQKARRGGPASTYISPQGSR